MARSRYLITNRQAAGGTEALLSLAARHLAQNIAYLQIREKDLEARALFDLTCAILALPRQSTKIIVNSRLDVALAAGAHGVHLPSNSPAAARLRPLCPAGFLIGESCHTVEEVRASQADYCLFGPVFAPISKDDARRPHGLEGLRAAVAVARLPVFALGGITEERVESCAEAGACGVAGISLFLGSPS